MKKITSLGIALVSTLMLSISITYSHGPIDILDQTFLFGDHFADMYEIQSFITKHHTKISILEHKSGTKFILKQDTRNTIWHHFATIRDALGSLIAQSINAPANIVIIIPAHQKFVGKQYEYLPATLHTFVPGVMVKTLSERQHLRIKQPLKAGVATKGLTRQVITNMATHPDLCIITALDTFTANKDRHQGNFFYDEASDHFFAIDLESAFSANLAHYASILIDSLLKNKQNPLTPKEIRALTIYRNTLNELVQLHTPESMYQTLTALSLQAGITPRSMYADVKNKLHTYKKAIAENYTSCKELIGLLDILLKQQT